MTGVLIAIALLWLGAVALSLWARAIALRGKDELEASLFYRVIQVYTRVVHRVRYEGLEHARAAARAHGAGRPVVVAPNHTAGIDPLLVQAALPFEVRWMMASDMRAAALEDLWSFGDMIFVDRDKPDPRALRAGLRHLKGGDALGVFPEGHIERPARTLLPFRAGVGMLVAKADPLVLPVVIDGTPQIDPAWEALKRPSRSRVRFLEPVDYTGRSAREVVDDLHARFVEATGWPTTDRTPIVTGGHHFLIDLQGRYYDARTGERFTDGEVHAIVDQDRGHEHPQTSEDA